jgi:hypothetical protein
MLATMEFRIFLSSYLVSMSMKIIIYKNIILFGCETLFLILREEYRLRLYENMVLKKIFEPKKE